MPHDPATRRFVRPRVRMAQAADWVEEAACADPSLDPDWWHASDVRDRELALLICGGCPVRVQCLAAAHAEGDTTYPVRGGVDFNAATNAKKKGRGA